MTEYNLDDYRNGVQISFHGKPVKYGQSMTKKETSIEPTVDFLKTSGKSYTIMMVDPDAPSALDPRFRYFLHWLIVDNVVLIDRYMGPSPPKNSGEHRYYTCVLEQDHLIGSIPEFMRPNFNVVEFVRNNGMKLIGCSKFIVTG
jgi:large subunit ribosomal protein L35